MQTQIKGFNIEISSDRFHIQMHKKPPNDRIATISGLLSGTAHYVTVVAVYKDDFKATSEMVRFTTQGNYYIAGSFLVYLYTYQHSLAVFHSFTHMSRFSVPMAWQTWTTLQNGCSCSGPIHFLFIPRSQPFFKRVLSDFIGAVNGQSH